MNLAEKTRVAVDGFLEGYDDVTGEILWRQKSKEKTPKRIGLKRGRKGVSSSNERIVTTNEGDKIPVHDVLDGKGRLVTVPIGVDPSTLPAKPWPYNAVTAEHVITKIAEGSTIEKIGKLDGFPSARTIYYWMTQYPDFKRAMKEAKTIRAEFYHDQVIKVADEAQYEEDVPVARLKKDVYQWAAKVGDPDTYGDKVKHSGDPDAPLGFIIATGVPAKEEIEVPSSPQTTSSQTSGEAE